MSEPWRRYGHDDLEARLRSARPEPDDELVARLSTEAGAPSRTRGPRPSGAAGWRPLRLALALVTAAAAFGSIFAFAQEPGSTGATDTPAADQYEEKVTICHRPPGNPSNGQTLTLPRSAAEAHLRQHPLDTLGPCPGSEVLGVVETGGSGGKPGGDGGGAAGTGSAGSTAVDPGDGVQGTLAFTGLALGILASLGFVLLLGGWLVRWRGTGTERQA
jgi:hypothetical protein